MDNLAEVQVLTGLMLARLTALHRALDAAGGRLALCSPTPTLREILGLLGVSSRVCVYDSEQEALRSFAGAGVRGRAG